MYREVGLIVMLRYRLIHFRWSKTASTASLLVNRRLAELGKVRVTRVPRRPLRPKPSARLNCNIPRRARVIGTSVPRAVLSVQVPVYELNHVLSVSANSKTPHQY